MRAGLANTVGKSFCRNIQIFGSVLSRHQQLEVDQNLRVKSRPIVTKITLKVDNYVDSLGHSCNFNQMFDFGQKYSVKLPKFCHNERSWWLKRSQNGNKVYPSGHTWPQLYWLTDLVTASRAENDLCRHPAVELVGGGRPVVKVASQDVWNCVLLWAA